MLRLAKILMCFACVYATFNVGIRLPLVWGHFFPPYSRETDKVLPYTVTFDNGLTPQIEIAVDENANASDLCLTMAEIADRHQDDEGREYWFGTEYLVIRAHLTKDGKRSYFNAGTLYRYIPIRNPIPETTGRADQCNTRLWLARLSL